MIEIINAISTAPAEFAGQLTGGQLTGGQTVVWFVQPNFEPAS